MLNFRNLEETELSFSPRVNLFLGANGQGKTNLLEALYYIAWGRSHRGSRNEEMIRFDADHLHVALTVEDEAGRRLTCEYGLERGGGRRWRWDEQLLPRRLDLVGRLSAVFFDPSSVDLVRGGPAKRRRFVDRGQGFSERGHLTHLQAYTRALRQKARLLKELRRRRTALAAARQELQAWNDELALHAAAIASSRAAYAAQLEPLAANLYRELAGTSGGMEFRYRPALPACSQDLGEDDLRREFLAEFDYIMESEIKRGRPLCGPQTDDFEVRFEGRDLRIFGSQGEKRTAAVALVLAQSEVVFLRRQVRPVLFFDDIFSELDRQRSQRLQEMAIQNHQVFIATARQEDVSGWRPDQLRVWEIQQGRLEEVA
jgi:DNA replication and repair protein RecF